MLLSRCSWSPAPIIPDGWLGLMGATTLTFLAVYNVNILSTTFLKSSQCFLYSLQDLMAKVRAMLAASKNIPTSAS